MRLIDADMLYVDWYDSFVADDGTEYDNIPLISKGQIDDAPTIELKRGKWIETEERKTYIGADWDADPIVPVKYRLPMCSICGKEFGTGAFDYNFCPNCGADMREREGK